jgi:hypothetical protein
MFELLLPAAPLLALLVSLLFGFYPGCETAMRLADRIASLSRSKAATIVALPARRSPQRAAHGGLLLAFSLSGRAPPA